MKKIAFILSIFFATVQLAPVVTAIFSKTTSVFIADEEKGEDEASNNDKKEHKDYNSNFLQSDKLANKIKTAFHDNEKIHTSPCLEKLTPPPNFY